MLYRVFGLLVCGRRHCLTGRRAGGVILVPFVGVAVLKLVLSSISGHNERSSVRVAQSKVKHKKNNV